MVELPEGCLKTEMPEERKTEHLVMTDMTPPNSIANEELERTESTQSRQEPVQERIHPPRVDPPARPYQSQCRGKKPLDCFETLRHFFSSENSLMKLGIVINTSTLNFR
jgi:hypothetical protein